MEQIIAHSKPAKRNRGREDAGKSERSWIKHDLLQKAANGQINAYRVGHSKARIAIIDANAGDGKGVPCPQSDLFEDVSVSIPTATLTVGLGVAHGGDVFLCEKHAGKRKELTTRFPRANILKNHADVPALLEDYDYTLVLSDPCGPGGHGIEHLVKIARKVRHADFIIVFNECFITRVDGVRSPSSFEEDTPQRRAWQKAQQLYAPMIEPKWWAMTLGRRRIARTCLVRASNNFQYRVLVVANYLSHPVQRRPFEVIA